MPKMKTKSAAKKRFSFTGTGKIKRKHAFKSHILTKKSTKRKRNLTYFDDEKADKFCKSNEERKQWLNLAFSMKDSLLNEREATKERRKNATFS